MAEFTIRNGQNQLAGTVLVLFTPKEDTTRMVVYNKHGLIVGTYVRSGWGFANVEGEEKGICRLPEPQKPPKIAKAYTHKSQLIGGVDGDRIYRTNREPLSDGLRAGFVEVGVWTDLDELLVTVLGDQHFGNNPNESEHPNRLDWEERERKYRLKLYTVTAGCGALLSNIV